MIFIFTLSDDDDNETFGGQKFSSQNLNALVGNDSITIDLNAPQYAIIQDSTIDAGDGKDYIEVNANGSAKTVSLTIDGFTMGDSLKIGSETLTGSVDGENYVITISDTKQITIVGSANTDIVKNRK